MRDVQNWREIRRQPRSSFAAYLTGLFRAAPGYAIRYLGLLVLVVLLAPLYWVAKSVIPWAIRGLFVQVGNRPPMGQWQVNYWHPLAVPFCVVAVPLWIAIVCVWRIALTFRQAHRRMRQT